MSIRVTQLGNEVWVHNPSNIRVTQIGNEVWIRPSSRIRVTQVGLEVWRGSANAPLTAEGHADGIAYVYALTDHALPIVGTADGFATARETSGGPDSAIMVIMGI